MTKHLFSQVLVCPKSFPSVCFLSSTISLSPFLYLSHSSPFIPLLKCLFISQTLSQSRKYKATTTCLYGADQEREIGRERMCVKNKRGLKKKRGGGGGRRHLLYFIMFIRFGEKNDFVLLFLKYNQTPCEVPIESKQRVSNASIPDGSLLRQSFFFFSSLNLNTQTELAYPLIQY